MSHKDGAETDDDKQCNFAKLWLHVSPDPSMSHKRANIPGMPCTKITEIKRDERMRCKQLISDESGKPVGIKGSLKK